MTNTLLILIAIELFILVVTKIVMLTKTVKQCNILVMIKNMMKAYYETFGGILPEDLLDQEKEDFPASAADDGSIGGLE